MSLIPRPNQQLGLLWDDWEAWCVLKNAKNIKDLAHLCILDFLAVGGDWEGLVKFLHEHWEWSESKLLRVTMKNEIFRLLVVVLLWLIADSRVKVGEFRAHLEEIVEPWKRASTNNLVDERFACVCVDGYDELPL